MQDVRTPLPLLFGIAVTRGLLGVGIGLLLSEKIGRKYRMKAGIALAAISAATTIPLILAVRREQRASEPTVANVPQSGADKKSEEMLAH